MTHSVWHIGKKLFSTYLCVIQGSVGLLLSMPLQAAPNVAVSIAPIHSLVAGVMAGVGTPELLIPVGQSPHNYALRPSAVQHIYAADLIVWIGANYEIALASAIAQASTRSLTQSLASLPALKTYPVRTGAFWESGEHHEDHDDNADRSNGTEKQSPYQEFIDPHVWLSTDNSKIMVNLFRTWLTAIDSENAAIYQSNAERLIARINLLQSHLQQQLKPVATIPYLVFHDAYQYFEKEFNLNPLGSITLKSEISPGVRRVKALRKMIANNGVKCLFNEPQFKSKLIPTLIESTAVRLGQLDPLGSASQPGPELWFELMATMGQSLRACL